MSEGALLLIPGRRLFGDKLIMEMRWILPVLLQFAGLRRGRSDGLTKLWRAGCGILLVQSMLLLLLPMVLLVLLLLLLPDLLVDWRVRVRAVAWILRFLLLFAGSKHRTGVRMECGRLMERMPMLFPTLALGLLVDEEVKMTA